MTKCSLQSHNHSDINKRELNSKWQNAACNAQYHFHSDINKKELFITRFFYICKGKKKKKSKKPIQPFYIVYTLTRTAVSLYVWWLVLIKQTSQFRRNNPHIPPHSISFYSPKKLASKSDNWGSFPHDCCQVHLFLEYPI